MFDMVVNAMKLFVAGKLFRNNLVFFRQWGMGFGLSSVLMLVIGFFQPWLGIAVGGVLGGALLPWLVRDLKYN